MSRAIWIFVSALAAGCSSYSKGTQTGGLGESGMADTGSADDTDFAPDDATPQWWELAGTVTILDGAADANTSSLAVTLLDPDQVSICSEQSLVRSIVDEASLPDAEIYTWWRVTVGRGDSACEDSPLPRELLLGFGAMHPDIAAALGPAGLDTVANSLNGAYVSFDDDLIYAFGVAGPAEAFAGAADSAITVPLADGEWQIVPIFPFNY